MALSLYPDYHSQGPRDLMARDEISMLQIFFERSEWLETETLDQGQTGHIIALGHGLLEASGGIKSAFWHLFDHRLSDFENQCIYGLMADADLPHHIQNIQSPAEVSIDQLYCAMLKSKLRVENRSLRLLDLSKSMKVCQNLIDGSLWQRNIARSTDGR
ncbi:hypothetical protein FOXG_21372 [Fusarium oxysporum f. sp. lycopersici 4287]|nr:hypothetical protein FOXG_20934 [Fusarium oxysporum f. sp. lycopersici 4287]XP_018253589.1 hypothetical protein FOXG_21372 [Fusarium oxysporum f. sp. lycopersici 4287]EWZ79194.1 hypothetical protein FOWG_16641 [Fusarium oxysporum f. sp. lycopersici MN25]KNB13812.1 hypothetical protein FOXG_20934 [Fusarium oxysporum f. sp. lycopersici 4287]KNB15544.1 hypothetical protein FOXG_21372 [Fusarium oxysporum f. sp. lycopersici 4287]